MSIFKLYPDGVESFSTTINSKKTFISSFAGDMTGSVQLFKNASRIEKDIKDIAADGRIDVAAAMNPGDDKKDALSRTKSAAKNNYFISIDRWSPDIFLTSSFYKKFAIAQLHEKYRHVNNLPDWGFVNYQSLNFFTASSVTTSSVLLYPNISSGSNTTYVTGVYTPQGPFSFSFRINPRYKFFEPTKEGIDPGTIFHLSSCYAISLATGSLKDENGYGIGYRLQLQLSHSADVAPSKATAGNYPNDLTFFSDDNSLLHNKWHHVAIRWGTNQLNQGTGSFIIDGVERGTFHVPSSSIVPKSGGIVNPDVLCIGNYYEGPNAGNLDEQQKSFFSTTVANSNGLKILNDSGIFDVYAPNKYSFAHPLNAEVHELSIHNKFLNIDEVQRLSSGSLPVVTGSDQVTLKFEDTVAFYVPPIFINSSSLSRIPLNGTQLNYTQSPYNTWLSYMQNGHYINLQNYVTDIKNRLIPRQFDLTASLANVATIITDFSKTDSDHLSADKNVRKRNLTILPCDDGNFRPNFSMLNLNSSFASKAIDDFGVQNLSIVNLSNLIKQTAKNDLQAQATIDVQQSPSSIFYSKIQPAAFQKNYIDDDRAIDTTVGRFSADVSSNQIVVFNISNIFYGNKITPGSITISDHNLSGGAGQIKIILKDDGQGGIYRHNSATEIAKWNSVGSVFYDEGIIIIKNPHLYFFGKNGFEINFEGEQNLHVAKFDLIAPENYLNKSNNPQYVNLPQTTKDRIKPSGYDNDPDKKFVYITGINLHDENMNIVMKAKLAQPIVKRVGDRLLFRLKYDY